VSHLGIGGRRGRRSSTPSAARSTGCCASIRGCPGKRVRELLEEQGYVGGKTIVDDLPA